MHRSALCLLLAAFNLCGIDIRIYSEFQRVDLTGSVIPQDRAATTREVLSPAVARNAFASFRVVVTAPPNTLYFLAVQTNPPNVFGIKVYRESFDQTLTEERNPSFLAGVTPSINQVVRETATAYLLDVWVPSGANPGPARLEVLVKTAFWKVAPMEIRILPISVPPLLTCVGPVEPPGPEKPSYETAFRMFFESLTGDLSKCAPPASTAASVLLRNAMQDAALARTLNSQARRNLLRSAIVAYTDAQWPLYSLRGGESYLGVRQLLYREAPMVR